MGKLLVKNFIKYNSFQALQVLLGSNIYLGGTFSPPWWFHVQFFHICVDIKKLYCIQFPFLKWPLILAIPLPIASTIFPFPPLPCLKFHFVYFLYYLFSIHFHLILIMLALYLFTEYFSCISSILICCTALSIQFKIFWYPS